LNHLHVRYNLVIL